MSSRVSSAYEHDFYAWAMTNAKLLREGKLEQIDVEHVAEELEGMGKTQQRVLISRLTVLLAHLMKWQLQPELRSRSWKNTIRVQRIDFQELLQDNPSLGPQTGEALSRAYQKAKLLAAGDTNMDETGFPETCPYSFEQVMDEAFWPEGGG
ncbi:MAG: DUF29 domain-containing protein [Gammaproteobacteria bacterium]